MASNWKSLGGIYVDMTNYAKIYNLMPENDLPRNLYLDKNTAYSFNVFLTIRTAGESRKEGWLIWGASLPSFPSLPPSFNL